MISLRFMHAFASVAVLVAAAPAVAAAPPDIALAGSPTLYVTTSASVGSNTPVAWIVFRTRRHLSEPRQVVARAGDRSGRSYGLGGTCIRSTIVKKKAGAPGFTRGRTYRVQLYSRATIHDTQRKLIYSGRLPAHGATRFPGCGSS